VGAKGVETTVSLIAVINFNGSGNGDSSVNVDVGDEPRISSKLTLPNAYSLKPIINKSGSYILGYHRSVTGYMVIPLASLKSCNIIMS
jgi:hypothetical protein